MQACSYTTRGRAFGVSPSAPITFVAPPARHSRFAAPRATSSSSHSASSRRCSCMELLDSNPVEGVPPDPKKASFEALLKRATADEVVWEFNFFLKSLSHNMIPNQRNDIVHNVRKHLRVVEAKKELARRDVNADPFFSSSSVTETPLLDALSTLFGRSLIYITPPTRMCILCRC